jgi:polysaccharide pyruvyl transferase WcaK-like protein
VRVLVLHAYSALNAGDGLLLDETVALVREAAGPDVQITVAASRPESFSGRDLTVVNSQPSLHGYSRAYLGVMRKLKAFDLVVSVGGGYLRTGYPLEALKCILVHGVQLLFASWRGTGVVYLPQSIGPLRLGFGFVFRRLLGRIEHVFVRDDRTVAELRGVRTVRMPDLAIVSHSWGDRDPSEVLERPVLSVRAVRSVVPTDVRLLAAAMGAFDGYVQSATGGNDDTAAMASVAPEATLSRDALLDPGGPRRVVVAMRLHAALMAMQAGHYVIHLAYERKGFGAYDDLGIGEYCHNSFSFGYKDVQEQVLRLLNDPEARAAYDRAVRTSRSGLAESRERLVDTLRHVLERDGRRHG